MGCVASLLILAHVFPPLSRALVTSMNKAIYLALIYLSPALSLLAPVDHFQAIWLVYYVPFALAYAIYVWFKPTENLTKYIFYTPPLFLLFILIAILLPYGVNSGFNSVLEFLPAFLIIAIPFGFIIGAIYVILALLLLKGLERAGFIMHGN